MIRSQDPDSSDCGLDLSIKEVFVIVYFPESDPGNEYELFSEHSLAYETWNTLAKGARVAVKFGKARVHGTIVAVSDDRYYLEEHFKSLVESHQMEIKSKSGLSPFSPRWCMNRPNLVEKCYIKVTDTATQTDGFWSDDSKPFTSVNKDYLELQTRHRELEQEHERLKDLVSDIRKDLNKTTAKLQYLNNSEFNNSSSMSISSSETEPFKPLENCQENCEDSVVQIGPHGTTIPQYVYDTLNWNSHTSTTRKLLVTLFPRSVLATHSVTGKASPAFQTKERKTRLNPEIISDIISIVTKRCKVSETIVRSAITAKCCDENKMLRKRVECKRVNETDKENS